MENYFISQDDLLVFANKLIELGPVIAPVANQSRFSFQQVASADQIRLDYDTTVLPPKKELFPPHQKLIEFDAKDYCGCIEPQDKILFGVHPYDARAIQLLDMLFEANHQDNNYLSQRKATTIIASGVENHYKHAFFGSLAQKDPALPASIDMFLTKIENGYLVTVLTEKGKDLIQYGAFTEAAEEHQEQAQKTQKKMLADCPQKLTHTPAEIKEKLDKSWENPIWEEASRYCFSCGSCNTVCPTCYCFDVQDEWNIDQKSGVRYRRWDACLTTEFAEVSVQGGSESFRKTKSSRFRHRIMRKFSYLNDKLDGPACVGCGRCSGACTANIADPVTFLNKLMDS